MVTQVTLCRAAEDARQGMKDAGIIVDDQDAGTVGFDVHAAPSDLHGQRGPDARSRSRGALDLKLAAHLCHDRPADGQSKPVAVGLGREEGFLDLGQVLLGDAASRVFDDQLDRRAVAAWPGS